MESSNLNAENDGFEQENVKQSPSLCVLPEIEHIRIMRDYLREKTIKIIDVEIPNVLLKEKNDKQMEAEKLHTLCNHSNNLLKLIDERNKTNSELFKSTLQQMQQLTHKFDESNENIDVLDIELTKNFMKNLLNELEN